MRLTLLCAAALAACAPSDDPGDTDGPTDSDVTAPSRCDVSTLDAPVTIGHRTFEHTYQLPYEDDPRTILVHLWYPSTDATGTPPRYLGSLVDDLSFEDATHAFADSGCTAPVYAYSHGSRAWAGNHTPVTKPLIEGGWVVVAPDHAGNTLPEADPVPPGFDLTRALDVQASLDAVEALPSDDVLAGRLLTDAVVVGGHSYGGQTTWLLSGVQFDMDTQRANCGDNTTGDCAPAVLDAYAAWDGDPRVVAAVALDGNIQSNRASPETHQARQVPMLMMTAGAGGSSDAAFEAAATDVSWAALDGACHETFTATTLPCEGMDKEEGWDIVHAYLVPFAERYGLGETSADGQAILDGTQSVSDRVTYQVQ